MMDLPLSRFNELYSAPYLYLTNRLSNAVNFLYMIVPNMNGTTQQNKKNIIDNTVEILSPTVS